MAHAPAGTVADQIISVLQPFLAHQRQKWAAQCQAYGLSMTHFQVMAILDADGPTAMSRLAEQIGVSFSNATGIVGRLEEREVVIRVHDRGDRRIVLAQLTDAGREMLRHVEEVRLAHLRQLLDTMTLDEQRTVLSAMKLLGAARKRFTDAQSDSKEPLPA